ncbi:MAG: glycogen debranching enzyme N-terminal domain-containing protein [Rikenellaceae bacterium]
MVTLTFDKNELGNLEYSLQREMLATDRRGGYMSTTIVCCNTRKYHGLIVSPIDSSERDFVLLSSLDETIIRDGQRFNLALHGFKGGTYEPRGHKYITDFEYTPCPTITYRIGDVVLRKELLWIHKRTQLMVKYTLVEGGRNRPVTLQLRPFLAFRDRHELSKANLYADGRSYEVTNGVKCRLYDAFPWLYMQTNRQDVEYVPAPDWYYDFEYMQEVSRGYEGLEDLLTPGYFEVDLKHGESIIFSASTDEMFSGETIDVTYAESVARRTHKIDFKSCLEHSARQFVARKADGRVEVIAGYPWYGVVGRDAMISLPGLTLTQGHKEDCMDVFASLARDRANGTLRDSFKLENAVDCPLWTFRTTQMLEKQVSRKEIWTKYGEELKAIIEAYATNAGGKVSLHDNGLIWAWSNDAPISWMDFTVDTAQVEPRNGYHVEVNALWYNAVSYALDLAKEFGDSDFVAKWEDMPAKTKESFLKLFWMDRGWLADFVNYDVTETSIRPNMIIACALDYKMVDEEQQVNIIRTVEQHLLTTRGLRSLTPLNPLYGSMVRADWNNAPKNGSVWVWPLAFYVKACFDVLGASFVAKAEDILEQFNEEIQVAGICSISEYFEPNPPYHSRGAISCATAVAALLEITQMIESYKVAEKTKKVAKPRAKAATTKSTATKAKTTATKTTAKVAPKKRVAKAKVEE